MDTAPRIALVSFDLDGTLLDTAAEIAEAANRALAEHGLPRQGLAEVTALVGHGGQALVRRLLQRLGSDAPADAVFARFEHHAAALAGTLATPYPGAQATLQRLRDGGVLLACVTNKEARLALRLLRHHALEQAFACVLGGDTLPVRKPQAGVLGHVVQTLGVPLAAAAHVGDSAIDVQAARNAGVAAWAVPWGYNGGQPVEDAAPDRVFASLPAVADHVLGAG